MRVPIDRDTWTFPLIACHVVTSLLKQLWSNGTGYGTWVSSWTDRAKGWAALPCDGRREAGSAAAERPDPEMSRKAGEGSETVGLDGGGAKDLWTVDQGLSWGVHLGTVGLMKLNNGSNITKPWALAHGFMILEPLFKQNIINYSYYTLNEGWWNCIPLWHVDHAAGQRLAKHRQLVAFLRAFCAACLWWGGVGDGGADRVGHWGSDGHLHRVGDEVGWVFTVPWHLHMYCTWCYAGGSSVAPLHAIIWCILMLRFSLAPAHVLYITLLCYSWPSNIGKKNSRKQITRHKIHQNTTSNRKSTRSSSQRISDIH